MEIFDLYDKDRNKLNQTMVRGDEQPEGTFWFVGNGAEKFKEISACSNACFDVDLVPLAADMRFLAETAFAKSDFVDVAYFEPYYLKDFVATISKKNVLA